MRHPLDPLTTAELRAAVEVVCRTGNTTSHDLRFNSVSLQEPRKQAMLDFNHGGSLPPRRAALILQVPSESKLVEATVDLSSCTNPEIMSWKELKGVQPMLTPDDCDLAERICKADPQVKHLLAKRGISDTSLVAADPWSVHLAPKQCRGARLVQTFMYLHKTPDDNAYARPLDFTPLIDLNTGQVVHIDMPHGDKPPTLPNTDMNYHRDLAGNERPWRPDLKPLDITQPEGPSYTVEGHLIRWQKWHIRISFNFKEGLVLHDVGYYDGKRLRPIVHRASLVEMCVPYGDPNPPFERKCAFDVGDYGLGYCANSLELGCDCLGAIHYFDANFVNSKGEPYTVKKAVCLHEEDAGMIWKHTEYRTGHAEVRRARRLVLSFVATVVNYEYAFYWYFSQDGTITYEIKLTGELSTSVLSPSEGPDPRWGTLVAPHLNAQVHQHMFAARLDLAIDDDNGGKGLAVSEVNLQSMPAGGANVNGNGFWATETKFRTEGQAQRRANPATGRIWKISNPAVKHPTTGKGVAYKLVPGGAPTLLVRPDSRVALRGGFALNNLWVTPHSDVERFPSGNHTVMSEGGQGLTEWVKQDREIGPGSDPVLWHCFGVSHVPRPEDFPVMPVETVSWQLRADGFFNGNDAVDIPHAPNAASTCCTSQTNGHAQNGCGVNGHS